MKIVSKLPCMLTILGVLFYMGSVSAAVLKIGVVDGQKLLQQSPQAQAASKEMEQKFDSRRKDLLAQQNNIKNLQDQISRNGAVMSAAQLQDLESQLDSLQQSFNRKQNDFQDDVNAYKNAELGKIYEAISKAVQEFAKSQQYNLIIGQGIMFADGTVDVTDQVLSQLQKDFQAQNSQPPGKGGH